MLVLAAPATRAVLAVDRVVALLSGHGGGVGRQIGRAAQPPHQYVADRFGGAEFAAGGGFSEQRGGLVAWLGLDGLLLRKPSAAGGGMHQDIVAVAGEAGRPGRGVGRGQGGPDRVVGEVAQAKSVQ